MNTPTNEEMLAITDRIKAALAKKNPTQVLYGISFYPGDGGTAYITLENETCGRQAVVGKTFAEAIAAAKGSKEKMEEQLEIAVARAAELRAELAALEGKRA